MFRALFILIFALVISGCASTQEPLQTSPQIILKLDDMRIKNGAIDPAWVDTFNYLESEGITATIGVIGEDFETASPTSIAWIKARHDYGHELWNHGYCHCRDQDATPPLAEFRGRDFAFQSHALSQTQEVVKTKTGITMQSFGAPYNAVDAATAQALLDEPNLRIWLYGNAELIPVGRLNELTVLPRIPAVNIEYPVHQPDAATFIKAYQDYQIEPVLIIQGHPSSWFNDRSRFAEFQKIITFLKSDGAKFTTAINYVDAR